MSRRGETRPIPWADGEYVFRLNYGGWLKVQEACDAGPPLIAARLREYDPVLNPRGDNYRVDDIRETIRQGLLGARVQNVDALIRKYVDEVPWEDNRLIAWIIIASSMSGSKEEPLGKAEEPMMMKANGSPEERSPSENLSGLPEQSDVAQPNSTI